MAVALDSDVVIGFLDRGDALHAPAEKRIRSLVGDGEPLVASVISVAEVLTGAKLGHHDETGVRGFFDELISEVVPVDLGVAERAAELRAQRRSLRMPDALVVATADLHADVELLVCADRRAMQLEGLGCSVELLT